MNLLKNSSKIVNFENHVISGFVAENGILVSLNNQEL